MYMVEPGYPIFILILNTSDQIELEDFFFLINPLTVVFHVFFVKL